MKKKEVMKRMSALAMSAMMTVTMIPSNAFAADIEFSDSGQEAIEVQADEEDNAEISIQDEDTDNAEELMGEDLTLEDSEDASVDTEVFSDGAQAPVESDEDLAKANAAKAAEKDGKEEAKNGLRNLLYEVNKFLKNMEVGTGEDQYPEESKNELVEAFVAAKQVTAKENVTEEELISATETLKEALNKAQNSKNGGIEVAKERLRNQMTEVATFLTDMEEGTGTDQYPEGTGTELLGALRAAKIVLNKENVTKEELNEATKTLKAALNKAQNSRNGLKEEALDGLKEQYREGYYFLSDMDEGRNPGQYQVGSKAELAQAMAAAKAVLNKENATVAELNEATEALKEAIDKARDAEIGTSVTVRVNWKESTSRIYNLTVKSNTAARYGYSKPESKKYNVTVADAVCKLHEEVYGNEFCENPSNYLAITENGVFTKIFGEESSRGLYPFYVNNVVPTEYANAEVSNGNEISLFTFADTENYSDHYLIFGAVVDTICVGKEFDVAVKDLPFVSGEEATAVSGCTVELKNLDTEESTEFTTDETGVAKVKAEKAGNYQLTVSAAPYTYYFAPQAKVTVNDHVFDEGKVTKEPTCGEAGEKTYTCTVCKTTKTEEIAATGEHTFDEGKVTKEPTCKEAGEKTYTCTVCKTTKTESIAKTNDHKYTWKTIAKATVFAPAKQQGTCSVCGKKVTRNYGKKLAATVKLNATGIRLQYKHSTNKIKVKMANGDSVKSWTSSNKRIVTVNNKGVITAGTISGTAKVTVTLKSGKKASLVVKVQPTKVITTKIFGLRSSETLKVGQKLALKPVLGPVTSQDGITYTFSNRDVAVVNRNGVITARKKGTAKITVTSGRETFVIKVIVK